MNRSRLKFVALLCCICFSFSGCLPQQAGTLLSIYEISGAIKDRDFKKIEKYIDVEGILGDCVDVTLQETKSKLGIFGQFVDVASLAKPRVVSMSKSQIKSMVENGQLDKFAMKKELLLSSILGAKILSLFKKAKSKDRLEIIKQKATKNGERLILQLRLSPKSDWIPFDLTSECKNKVCRITKINNLDEIKGDILKEFLSGFTG